VYWRKAKHFLGRALVFLGGIEEEEINFLDQAVIALRESLVETPRLEAPREWQNTMVDLGWALQKLGERESDINRLREAKGTFEEVLVDLTSKVSPIDWCSATSGLGSTLRVLGELQNDTELLRQSITQFERSFDVISVTSNQLRWAVTHLEIGKVYGVMSELEFDDEYADRCRGECNKALEAFSGQAPVKIQNDVDNVLARLDRAEAC